MSAPLLNRAAAAASGHALQAMHSTHMTGASEERA